MSSIKTIIAATILVIAAFAGVGLAADSADAEPDAYILNYMVGDKTIVVTSTTATVTLQTLEEVGAAAPAGKTFKAWAIEPNQYSAGSTYVFAAPGTATAVAVWEEIVYTASFVVGDAVTDVTGTLAEAKDLSVLAPADPAKQGYIFAGWLAEGAEAPVATADLGVLSADVTFTAVFTIDWVVTFVDGDKSYTTHASDVIVPDLGERVGFTFAGWFIGDVLVEDPATYELTADTTFTAVWEPAMLTVTFMDGSEVVLVQTVPYGQQAILPASGFDGWATKAVQTVPPVEEGAPATEEAVYTAFDFSTPVTADLVLYGVTEDTSMSVGMQAALVIGGLVLGLLVWGLATKRIVIPKKGGKA